MKKWHKVYITKLLHIWLNVTEILLLLCHLFFMEWFKKAALLPTKIPSVRNMHEEK